MLIIGVDFHSRFQQIAMVDTETGELVERRLDHSNGEAKEFYGSAKASARGHGSSRLRAMARGDASQAGARALGGRFRRDTCGDGAEAEDGCAGCSAYS